jgi:hypothetical protein
MTSLSPTKCQLCALWGDLLHHKLQCTYIPIHIVTYFFLPPGDFGTLGGIILQQIIFLPLFIETCDKEVLQNAQQLCEILIRDYFASRSFVGDMNACNMKVPMQTNWRHKQGECY